MADPSDTPQEIPLEEAAKYPLPGMAAPGGLAFSPDDRLITYLYSPEGSLARRLYAFDPQRGEHRLWFAPPEGGDTEDSLTLEEKLRRERMRQLELGVTQYAWAAQANHLLLPLQGNLYAGTAPDQPLRRLLEGQGKPVLEARLSPDGEWAAYVQEAELYVLPFTGGQPRQLTYGARQAGKTHGLAEYIAAEEMQRHQGYWWSPDSAWIAFTEVDEGHIPVYRIVHQGKAETGAGAQEDHRYPFAGQANARLRLGVVSVMGGEPVWMDLGPEEDIYLARVGWLPDGRLWAQVQNRTQTQLDLLACDLRTGQATRLLRETSGVWINLHDIFYAFKRPLGPPYQGREGCFLWACERSGYRHLYLYNRQGELLRQLTGGEWMVDALAGVDEAGGQVYFTATRHDPRQCHLYAISLAGGEPLRLTQAAGTHSVVLDHACQRFIDTHHSLGQPPVVTLRALQDGARLARLYDEIDPRLPALRLEPPEMVSLANRHGTLLYGAIYRPPAQFGPGPHPTLVFTYGGPHAQMVADSWLVTVRMRAQHLRSLGFLVFTLDNRGSARRGLDFEAAIWHDMGHLEVEDQVDGVRWLVAQGLADPARVGIYGWSYGGYMAAMCLLRAPETFKAAVAGAPVSSWDGYDTHYTERYMGTPQSNPEGYRASSVLSYVDNLCGKLLLVHGLIDENVHFRHTARLVNALIAARKTYDLLLFPDERHTPRHLKDRVYMEERIRDFLVEHLMYSED
ncbi:MAG: S9 family peptidase [Chloroflexota bacterium]